MARSTTAGTGPEGAGYATSGGAGGRPRRTRSYTVAQGFTSGHRFPTKAVRYAKPTHQSTHTAIGVMFLNDCCGPNRPMTISRTNEARARSRSVHWKAQLLKTRHTMGPSSSTVRLPGEEPRRMNHAIKTNEKPTANPAPLR